MTRSISGTATVSRGESLRRPWAVILLGTLASSMVPALAAPLVTPAHAVPGQPGVPSDAIELFHEDFENGLADGELVLLEDYVGAGGETYDAEPGWDDPTQCNGFVLDGNTDDADITAVGCGAGLGSLQAMATDLGGLNGTSPPEDNHVVAAFTDGDPGANLVEFATEAPLALAVENRFISFSVSAAAVNCPASAPLLSFFLDDGGTEIPTTDTPINPCASGGVGNFASDSGVLFTGAALGIVMRNENGLGGGNDHAFDDIRVLDATPQLDKEFSPTVSPVGVPVDLVFTITNTSELGAKPGWSFVDTLPAGLTIADPASATTNCTNGTVTATEPDIIEVSGDLATGQASCTASVSVLFSQAGTYVNDASNISGLVGLNPPGAAQVASTDLPAFECTTTAFLSQGAPANMYEVDVTTGENEIVAPNFYPENINAIGYNPLDNYIYGWVTSGPEAGRGIARVGSDHVVEFLGLPSNWGDFGLGTTHHIGELDNDGHYWMSNGTYWVEIDLAPGSDTYMQVLDTGSVTPPVDGYAFADWAFNPQDGLLYTTAGGPNNNKRLWSFDRATGTLTDVANLGNIVNGAFGGAVYSDANNNLFTSHNLSGEIWHVSLPSGPASFLADGPAAPVNDGAICFNVAIALGPTIDLTKTADPTGPLAPGGTVQYTVTVTNVGTLSGFDVLVADPLPEGIASGTWTCTGDACPSPTGDMPLSETLPELGIDESVVYTIDAVVSDDPPEQVVNTAAVTGPEVTCGDPNAPTVPPCEAGVTNTVLPIVTVDKTTDANFPAAGDTIGYEIVVSNVGQGALDGEMAVSDPLPDGLVSGTWECTAADGAVCPGADGAMPLAETVTELPAGGVLTYTIAAVVSDDPPAELTNTATVDGPVTCQVNPITAPPCEDSVTVEVAQPALELVKAAEVEGRDDLVADVDNVIQYTFTVSNTGNVLMSGIEVNDPRPGVSTVVCPGDALAPGETMTCTASYTVTQADVDAGGPVENTATASGVPPGGDPDNPDDRITSPASEFEVALVDPAPALELEKLADTNVVNEEGEEIAYRFVVTNTGNVTLSDVAVDDPKLGSVTCPETVLAPGESVTCTGDAPYVVTAADVTAGEVVNIATASANGAEATAGAEVLSESAVLVTPLASPGLPLPLPATGAGWMALLLAGAGMLLTGVGLVSGGRIRRGPGGGPPAGGGGPGGDPPGGGGGLPRGGPRDGGGLPGSSPPGGGRPDSGPPHGGDPPHRAGPGGGTRMPRPGAEWTPVSLVRRVRSRFARLQARRPGWRDRVPRRAPPAPALATSRASPGSALTTRRAPP